MTTAVFSRETTGAQVVEACQDQVKGRTFAITGASDGSIGAEIAVTLAHAKPARIILLARTAAKVSPVMEKIKAVDASVKTTFIAIQLDDFDSVRTAASEFNNAIDKLDVLINCAGIMAVPTFTTNKHGVESQFATNHLGHFLFTAIIFDKIAAAGRGARIVNVTSDGYTLSPCRFEDYNFKDGKEYHAWSGYGQSKTANILFTRQLATKLADRGIVSLTIHPGVIFGTSLGQHATQELFDSVNEVAMRETGQPFTMGVPKTLEQGTSTALVAALDPRLENQSGSYLEDCTVHPLRDYAASPENAQRLWTLSEQLVGQKFVI